MAPLAFVFLEPLGLLALAGPIALILLSLRRAEDSSAFLGTARFFQSAGEAHQDRRRWHLPAWLLLTALSLTLGALALARPGVRPVPPAGVLVTMTFDESPSMFLVDDSSPGSPVRKRRIDRALEAFQDWAQQLEERVEGQVFVQVPSAADRQARTPRPWREVTVPARPPQDLAEPLWSALDTPGAVWITDAAKTLPARKHAGVFASGGALVPGPISVGPAGAMVLLADGSVAFEANGQGAGTAHAAPGLPDEVSVLLEVWAMERGLMLAAVEDDAALTVEGVGPSESDPATEVLRGVGRDGWEADVVVRSADLSIPLSPGERPWLVDDRGRALVTVAPGRIRVRFHSLSRAPKDPAAWAVSFARLFDSGRLTPPAVVAAAERAAAGSALEEAPSELVDFRLAAARGGDGDGADADAGQLVARRARTLAAAFRAALMGTAALLALSALALRMRADGGS